MLAGSPDSVIHREVMTGAQGDRRGDAHLRLDSSEFASAISVDRGESVVLLLSSFGEDRCSCQLATANF